MYETVFRYIRTYYPQYLASHPKGDFYLTIGKKAMIKKHKFEAYIDNQIRL